jgi:hypothetical protein
MKKHFIILSITLIIVGTHKLNAQVDSSDFISFFNINTGYQTPLADMKDRFGANAIVGAGFTVKTNKNWTFDFSYNYMFGTTVKNETSYLQNILTNEGFIIDGNGEIAEVKLMERGWNTFVGVGKIFPIMPNTKNSGIWFKTSIGLLEHKILIHNPKNVTPQIKGDYKKGYDKLANGFAVSPFLGYVWLNKKKIINTYVGVEMIAAWTEGRRSYDFVLANQDKEKRFDMVLGIKAGWVIPVYKRQPDPFYFK